MMSRTVPTTALALLAGALLALPASAQNLPALSASQRLVQLEPPSKRPVPVVFEE